VSQSQWVVVYLFVGFLVYITVRGQLPEFRDAIFSGDTTTNSTGVQKNPADTQSVGEAGGNATS
jgi:hypothetical protein